MFINGAQQIAGSHVPITDARIEPTSHEALAIGGQPERAYAASRGAAERIE